MVSTQSHEVACAVWSQILNSVCQSQCRTAAPRTQTDHAGKERTSLLTEVPHCEGILVGRRLPWGVLPRTPKRKGQSPDNHLLWIICFVNVCILNLLHLEGQSDTKSGGFGLVHRNRCNTPTTYSGKAVHCKGVTNYLVHCKT